MRRSTGVLLALFLWFPLAGCDDDDGTAQEIRESVEDAAGSAGARAAAETMRAALLADDLDAGETVRDVSVLERAAGRVPGDVDVSGIADDDGDGQDDDGAVELGVGDERACLVADVNGEVDVSGGACA